MTKEEKNKKPSEKQKFRKQVLDYYEGFGCYNFIKMLILVVIMVVLILIAFDISQIRSDITWMRFTIDDMETQLKSYDNMKNNISEITAYTKQISGNAIDMKWDISTMKYDIDLICDEILKGYLEE